MAYYVTVSGWTEDGLIGGLQEPVEIHNISLTSGASVSRGDLLCADSLGAYAPASLADDAQKDLCIAASDADSTTSITQAYFSGVFNREKVMVGGAASLTADAFESSLRKQNIRLTSMKG